MKLMFVNTPKINLRIIEEIAKNNIFCNSIIAEITYRYTYFVII